MKKYLVGLFVLVFGLSFSYGVANAATIFSENFGTGNTTTPVPGWVDGGISGDDSQAKAPDNGNNNDSVSPSGGRHAKIYGETAYICHAVNTTGYNSVTLSYEWRGDHDAESSDRGIVEIKSAAGHNCDDGSGWTQLQNHDMSNDGSWSAQSAFTNAGMNNTNFLLRFRNSSSSSNEDFRVDNVVVAGNAIATTGSLQVVKNTVGGNGTFSFAGNAGSFNITTASNTGSTTRTNLTPGNYSVTETIPSGWDQTSNTCTNVAVTAGNTATCTITNTKRGSLTVYKDVVNPDGGAVSDTHGFTVNLNGANAQTISENSSYSYTNLVPGTYTITENTDSSYDFVSFSADTDTETSGAQVIVSAGANTNLTITNKQKPGSVTVNKVVTNPNGGSAVAGDFSFSVNAGSAVQFIQDLGNSLFGSNTFSWNPGAVSITEVPPMGAYAISYSGCNFVLASNGNNTCTITNSDIPAGQGAITVVKNVINDDGGTKTVSDFNLYIGEMMVTSGQSNFLDPGEYTISEGELPNGYMQTSIVCSNGVTTTNGTVNLTEQSAWTCTVTNNDKPAHLTIVKNTVNNALNGETDGEFSFNISSQEAPITLSTEEGSASTTLELNAGSYTLTENLDDKWNLSSISCESEGDEVVNGVGLNLANGQNITCTFTNTRKSGSIKITKTIELGNGDKTVSDFMIHVESNDADVPESPKPGSEEGAIYGPLATGTYKVVEYNVMESGVGYAAHYEGDCDPTGVIIVNDGETAECHVTNTRFEHSGGGSSNGGEVLGAQTENTNTNNISTETSKEEPKPESKGEVLGESTESCTAYLSKYMFFGKKNDVEEVKKLQTFLNEHMSLTLVVDGVYSAATRDAVKSFQEKYPTEVLKPWGLTSGTGNVFKTTLRWINMIKCPSLKLPMPTLR